MQRILKKQLKSISLLQLIRMTLNTDKNTNSYALIK